MPALRHATRSATLAVLGTLACTDLGIQGDDAAVIANTTTSILDATATPALLAFELTTFPPILALQAIPGDSSNGVLPLGVIGKTYVWNAASHQYETSLRTGAPANGVRFILYSQGASGPLVPLEEVGAVDLADVGAGTERRLNVKIAAGPVDVAVYSVTGTRSATLESVSARGTVNGDVAHNPGVATRVDFELNADANLASGTTTLGGTLTGEDVRLELEYVRTTTNDHLGLTALHGSSEADLEIGHGGRSGSIIYNGVSVGTIDDGQLNLNPATQAGDADLAAFRVLIGAMYGLQGKVAPRLLRPFYMTF